ncbi:MAG: DHH family phosphoesterase, partial [Lachnospiraceae bacterium]|nr:DHH family phosphoesterase [Lachnospiraceae bacterium]
MTNLDKLLQEINRDHVYIQTHNFPDPDAIASAYGLQRLLELRGVHATICYKGRIDRYSTCKLVELAGIELMNIDDLEKELSDEDEVLLVDSQKGNANIAEMTGDEIICIDHHPCNNMFRYRFS